MSGNDFSLWFFAPGAEPLFVQSSMKKERLTCKMDQFISWFNPLGVEATAGRLEVRSHRPDAVLAVSTFTPGRAIHWKSVPPKSA